MDNLITDLVETLRELAGESAQAGDLNYAISELLVKALDLESDPRYNRINRAVGVLECVKLEFYRRLAVPYENSAMDKEDAGDIHAYAVFEDTMEERG